MVNAQLLDDKIDKSGFKIKHICDVLGITPSGFFLKRQGKRKFKVAEIYVLTDLLRLSEEDKQKIFFA